MTRLKSIEIIINGTESVKQDWTNHNIEIQGDIGKLMYDTGIALVNKIDKSSQKGDKK